MIPQRIIEKLSSWPVTLAICLLIVVGTLTVKFWPRTVPFDQCSHEYKKYSKIDGVDATFIKDFKVNDTVFVDVTLLEATDSVIWTTLKKDFEVPNPPPDVQQFIDNGEDLIYVKVIPKSTTTDTILDSYSNNLLAISHLKRTLTVFHIKNKEELNAVRHYNYDKSTNQ